jgi:hypothetical protein
MKFLIRMNNMDVIEKLQEWYFSNCDGDWEHSYGIRITTVDNPGWGVDINLSETRLEEKAFEKIKIRRAETDWVLCFVDNGFFKGRGGSKNLKEILEIFCNWAEID